MQIDDVLADQLRGFEAELIANGLVRFDDAAVLVEDEDDVRTVVRQLLEFFGCDVLEAANGDDALTLAARRRSDLDLLVTDIVMPGMSGWELGAKVRAMLPDLKVLYMSGYAENAANAGKALDSNASFLQKPFSAAALRSAVDGLLGLESAAVPEERAET